MRRLRWAQFALDDLSAISQTIGATDPEVAARVVLTIQQRARRLVDFPLSGERLDLGNARKLSIVRYPYVIAYTVDADAVTILRIRHTAEDWRPS